MPACTHVCGRLRSAGINFQKCMSIELERLSFRALLPSSSARRHLRPVPSPFELCPPASEIELGFQPTHGQPKGIKRMVRTHWLDLPDFERGRYSLNFVPSSSRKNGTLDGYSPRKEHEISSTEVTPEKPARSQARGFKLTLPQAGVGSPSRSLCASGATLEAGFKARRLVVRSMVRMTRVKDGSRRVTSKNQSGRATDYV